MKLRSSDSHPDHSPELSRLRRIIGQLEGVEKMIRERRYCPEILQQLRAANSAVKAMEVVVLRNHLSHCIRNSAKNDSSAGFEKKLNEVMELIRG